MSSLLDDIINFAVEGKQPLPDILRKCRLLGHERKNQRLKKWANQELNGYDSAEDLPDYRLVQAGAKGHFMGPFGAQLNHYPLPSAILEDIHKDFARKIPLTQGVSAYEGTIHSSESTTLMFPWPTDMVLYYQRKFIRDFALVSAWQDVSKSSIVELLDAVRSRMLKMALEIKDELGTSYTDLHKIQSKEAATNIQNIIFQNTGGSTNVAFDGSSIDASTTTQTHFLSRTFKAVQGTFGMTCPLPSANLIFAACMSALTPTTSKTPSCSVAPTRSPRFGTVALDSVAMSCLLHFDSLSYFVSNYSLRPRHNRPIYAFDSILRLVRTPDFFASPRPFPGSKHRSARKPQFASLDWPRPARQMARQAGQKGLEATRTTSQRPEVNPRRPSAPATSESAS